MNNISQTIKRLLFLSEEICSAFDDLINLSIQNRESSNNFDKIVEYLENFLEQESTLLDSLSKEELKAIIQNLYITSQSDNAINRCYVTVKNYLIDNYPDDYDLDEFFDELEEESENDNNEHQDQTKLELIDLEEMEDEDQTEIYRKQVIQRIAIIAIKKMYERIKGTKADNEIDRKYKNILLRHFKEYKYDFFSLDRDMEMLGVEYRFNVNHIPEIPKLNSDISSICFNECIYLIDELYLINDLERNPQIIEDTLFKMLCFDEYIKELTPEQIDKLINICYYIETMIKEKYFGNIGLQKLLTLKKNRH